MNKQKIELASDPFPRFIRSPLCEKFCEKNKTNKKILELTPFVEFDYKDEDFIEPIVTERDFSFFKWLMNDSFNWEVKLFKQFLKMIDM